MPRRNACAGPGTLLAPSQSPSEPLRQAAAPGGLPGETCVLLPASGPPGGVGSAVGLNPRREPGRPGPARRFKVPGGPSGTARLGGAEGDLKN